VYLTKEVLERCVKIIRSTLDGDSSGGKRAQERLSALRHFFAYLEVGKETRVDLYRSDNRTAFTSAVGRIVGLYGKTYVEDFGVTADKDGFAVGNNFLTTRLKNAGPGKPYPKRPGPLLHLENEALPDGGEAHWVKVHPEWPVNIHTRFDWDGMGSGFLLWLARAMDFGEEEVTLETLLKRLGGVYPPESLVELTKYEGTQEQLADLLANVEPLSQEPVAGESLMSLFGPNLQNVWIEKTSGTPGGGSGWEHGACLWSPSRNKAGAERNREMREVKPGDAVIHINDEHITATSVAAEGHVEEDEGPPEPGTYKDMGPFFRVALESFSELPAPVPLKGFVELNKELIVRERAQSESGYPFCLYGADEEVRYVQGAYLRRCTPALGAAFQSALSKPSGMGHSPYSVEQALSDVFMPEEDFQSMLNALLRKKNIVIEGPPGVGKTFVAKKLAYAFLGSKDPSRVKTIQFHQSYSYEDFMQGYRPNEDSGFTLREGVFYSFCNSARDGERHVFIIDEINRGNLSRIFGELMMLIEADKRGPEHAISLTYGAEDAEKFYVPEGVHLIGLMNTADRSLAMVDYALRRRFSFQSLRPEFGSKGFKDLLLSRTDDEHLVDKVIAKMTALNNEIVEDTKELGPGFAVGHSFFCPTPGDVVLDEDWYQSVVKNEIAPLIREYWCDKPSYADQMVEELY
jgi:MoxR-like ATPase